MLFDNVRGPEVEREREIGVGAVLKLCCLGGRIGKIYSTVKGRDDESESREEEESRKRIQHTEARARAKGALARHDQQSLSSWVTMRVEARPAIPR